MFTVTDIYIGNDIYNTAVGFLGQTFIKATVAGFHVEDGDVQALGANHTETTIGITQYEHRIGLNLYHELVALVNDITHGGTEVIANGIEVHFGVCKFQVLEEHTVEVIVIILAGMRQNHIEIFTTFIDNCCQSDDFGAGSHDNEQLEFSVILEHSFYFLLWLLAVSF